MHAYVHACIHTQRKEDAFEEAMLAAQTIARVALTLTPVGGPVVCICMQWAYALRMCMLTPEAERSQALIEPTSPEPHCGPHAHQPWAPL